MKKRSKYFVHNFVSIFLGGVGAQAMYVLMMNYTTIFFTDILGISAGVAGMIFLFSRIWDGINDPICGVWIEKSNPKFGKIPTFAVVGGVISAVTLVMLFTVPKLSLTGRTIWGTVAYNLFGMAFTAVTVATLLQMARGTDEPGERVTLTMAYTIACSVAGIVMASVITKTMTAYGAQKPENGYKMAAVFSAIIGMSALFGSAVLFRDIESEKEQEKKEKTKVLVMIKGVLKVPSFLGLVLGCCLSNIGYGILAADLLYYLTYVIKKPELMAALLPATYIGTFAGSILASFFTKMGKKKMLICSMLIMGIAGILIRFLEGNVIALICGYGLMAGASSIMVTFLQPALVDCAEYTEYKTGIRCQALTLTGFTFVSKMTAGFASAILGFALQFAKYNGTATQQTAGAVNMIRNMMFWPVIIAALLGALILAVVYKLDEQTMSEVRASLWKEK